MVLGLKTELRQLFQNLITNAIKFTKADETPTIHITFEELKDEYKFCIADQGIGIKKSHQEQIFNIFSKLHLSSQFSGQGIGLAFCKKIVELNKGKIWVKSKIDEGSKFYFTIAKNLK